jgi:hypothetical protein
MQQVSKAALTQISVQLVDTEKSCEFRGEDLHIAYCVKVFE